MIEMPGTLRCMKCGGTRSVTLQITADNHDIRRVPQGLRFGVRHVTVLNEDWHIDDHGQATCRKCKGY